MFLLSFQIDSVESYWDISNPIIFGGMLLIPLIYLIIGIRIILKNFTKVRKNEFLYFGSTLIFFGCFWWNTFLLLLTNSIVVSEIIYYIFSFGMFPIAMVLWIYSCFSIISTSYKKPILIISLVTLIIYEILFWVFLFFNPRLIGEIKGGFYWYPSPIFTTLLIILALLCMSGLVFLTRGTASSNVPNVVWKGRFLFLAFISLIGGGAFEILVPFSLLTFIISRIILVSASIEFYFAFFLPNRLFREENENKKKENTLKNSNKKPDDKKSKLSKIIACILLLFLFVIFPYNPFEDAVSFLKIASLYLALTNFIIYWDFGRALVQDFKLEVPKKEKIILNLIAINSFILLITNILEIFIIIPNFLIVFSNPLYLYIFFLFFIFGILNTYIIKFSNLKNAWTGSTFPTQEELVTKGYYKLCRHPIYFFSLFMFGGFGFFLNTWWTLINSIIIMICYLILGKCEENYFEENSSYTSFQKYSPYMPFGWFNPKFLKKRKLAKEKK